MAHETSAVQVQLRRGFQFEQAGTTARALDVYRETLTITTTAEDEAEARLRIARVLRSLSEWDDAIAEAREARRLAESVGANDLAAEAINVEVGVHQFRGDFDTADRLIDRALALSVSARVRGITLQNRGRGAAERRDFGTADACFTESVQAFREAGYELGMAIALTNLSAVARDKGDPARGLEYAQEATSLCRRLNALDVLLVAVQNEASALVALNRLDEAERLLAEALGHFTSARNPVRQAECLEIMGQMSEQRPDLETAARCYARALGIAQAAGDNPLIERMTKRLRSLEPSRDAQEIRGP
ncbi:MAG: tetratricopeptide repeat protein [bacterium]